MTDHIADNAAAALVCPITRATLVDPVVDPEGNTYERTAILAWLNEHGTSPVTRSPLQASQLTPNRAVADLLLAAASNGTQTRLGGSTGGATTAVNGEAHSRPVRPPLSFAEAEAEKAGVALTLDEAGSDTVVLVVDPGASGEVCGGASVNLCAVVDVSGSMSASAPSPGGEDAGLSVLDVVKHALRTTVSALGPSDLFSVVAFESSATTALPPTAMDSAGRARAAEIIESLAPRGGTNLWAGLERGLSLVVPEDENNTTASPTEPPRLSSIFLLTDGQPTHEPPRGHVPMLRRWLDSRPWAATTLTGDCFGFGNNLDSSLLRDLAIELNGGYAYIPDAGMVGTVFIHALSNLLSVLAPGVVASVEGVDPSDAALAELGGPGARAEPSWPGVVAPLPTLRYGQPRTLVLRRARAADGRLAPVTATVDVRPWHAPAGAVARRITAALPGRLTTGEGEASASASNALPHEYWRVRAAALLASAGRLPCPADLAALSADVAAAAASSSDLARAKSLTALAGDLSGEATLALDDAHYSRWGAHFLRSIAFAHAGQACNNFKDPGVQGYGGALFRTLRDRLDAAFDALPPPAPSRVRRSAPGDSGSRARIDFGAMYNRAGNPCFAGSSLVDLADGSKSRVDAVRVGDCLAAPDGRTGGSRVVAVVRTPIVPGSTPLVRLGDEGLWITPWHPVMAGGRWIFPAEAAEPAPAPLDVPAVYGFLLEGHAGEVSAEGSAVDSNRHAARVGGVWAVTLAHGLVGEAPLWSGEGAENDARWHPFFGSPSSARAALALPICPQSGVRLCGGTARSAETGLVVGLLPDAGAPREAWSIEEKTMTPPALRV